MLFSDHDDDYADQYYNDAVSWSTANDVTVSAGTTTSGIDAAMVESGTITGTITDAATGDPLASNCNISVTAESPSNSNRFQSTACTDASGGYTITGLPVDTYVVSFTDRADDYLDQYYNNSPSYAGSDAVGVAAGATTSGVDAAMVTGGTITGTITDAATGEPIANNCNININADNVSGFPNVGCTNSSGGYTIPGLPAGKYRVHFSDPLEGYADQYYDAAGFSDAELVTVTLGATTPGIDAAMVASGSISGTITDAVSGQPIANDCDIEINADNTLTGLPYSGGCTDGSGGYTILHLPAGTYTVEFYGEGYFDQYYDSEADRDSANPVTVTVGGTTSGINAAMVASGTITGTITDAATGDPIGNNCTITIKAQDTSTGIDYIDNCTDASGKYALSGLPAGTYKLKFFDTAHRRVSQWYDNEPNYDSADPVTVLTGGTTSGIDVAMVRAASGNVPADFDGDGSSDVAVFRPSTGQWIVDGSKDGHTTTTVWGTKTDIPVPGDYDGDGTTDIAIYRPTTGQWIIDGSKDGHTTTVWGTKTDIPTSMSLAISQSYATGS